MSRPGKVLIILAALLVAFMDGRIALAGIASDDYSQVAFNAASSFLFFHLAVKVVRIGFLPWRMVPTFFLIAGMNGASALNYTLDGEVIEALGKTVICAVWLMAAKKANKMRLLLKAEQK